MNAPDLKPCPVCRGPAHLYRADDVACRDAKCLGYKFRHVTAEQWNRRAADPTDAREARDAQMRAEGRVAGLREAAEIAGLNAWRHAGDDDYSRGMDAGAYHQVRVCCDAIRAHADKIEGEANG